MSRRPRTGKRKEWTSEEERILADLTGRGLSYEEIAREMGRSPNSVQLKAGRIGVGNLLASRQRRADAVAPEDVEAEFWGRVDRAGGPSSCWPWTGGFRSNGYGYFYERGGGPDRGLWQAHRFAYRASTGVHPGERFVCHACDNPACCNPAHLWLGDAKANAHDAMAKGRHVPPPPTDWTSRRRARPHHWEKLTPAQAAEVRRRANSGEAQTKIAADFRIGTRAVSKIKLGQRWGHV